MAVFGRIWSYLVEFGRIWSDLVVFGRIWSYSVGFGRIRSDLVGFGRIRSNLVGFGRGSFWEGTIYRVCSAGWCANRYEFVIRWHFTLVSPFLKGLKASLVLVANSVRVLSLNGPTNRPWLTGYDEYPGISRYIKSVVFVN